MPGFSVILPMRKNRDFMLLWTAQAVSELGSQMSLLVFPLIGYAISGSTRAAGLAAAGVLIGELLFGLPAGVIVDRSSRRRVLIVANLIGAATFATLAITALLDGLTIWLLLVLGVVSGAVSAVEGPAKGAATRVVVPRERLPEALAQSQARTQAARIAGPPLGGALYTLARAVPFIVDAASYLFAAVAISRVRHALPAPQPDPAHRPSVLRSLTDGLRFMFRTPVLRAMMTWAAFANFSAAYLSVVITLRLVRAGVTPAAIGAVETIAAAAGLLGAFAAPALVRRTRTGWLTVITGVICSTALFFTGFTTNFVLIGALWAAAGVLFPANNSGISAYMTAVVPDELQGRLFSAMGFVAGAVVPLAPVLAGILLALVNSTVATLIGSLVGIVAVAPLIVNGETRRLGRPGTWPSEPA